MKGGNVQCSRFRATCLAEAGQTGDPIPRVADVQANSELPSGDVTPMGAQQLTH